MRSLLIVLPLVACLPQVGPKVSDGGVNDGGAAGGAGGGDPGCSGFAGCITFVAGTAVDFPNLDRTYAPKCLRLTAGQAVTFSGDFASHPLHQACGPTPVLEQTFGTSAQFTLSVPGTYGYYCGQHGSSAGTDMAGAIEVVP